MNNSLLRDAVLRIGEVSGIEGRTVSIKVDKNKNSSDLLFDGDVVKNVSVGGYVEIRKGFSSIIGKVDGERLLEDSSAWKGEPNQYQVVDRNRRTLTISLVGYIDTKSCFVGGIKELPLIGNEAFVLTQDKIQSIHRLIRSDSSLHISVARTAIEEVSVDLPIDGIFNSHLAIFGNTGSGKSNTVAALYQGLFDVCGGKSGFKTGCYFLFFDFNGEYTKPDCITPNKTIYNLKTDDETGDKLPVSFEELFDSETLSVLVEATDKTQKPFLKRALKRYRDARSKDLFGNYLRAIVQNKIKDILVMANKDVAYKLLDYIEEIIEMFDETATSLRDDIEFHNKNETFLRKENGLSYYFSSCPAEIENTVIYKATSNVINETAIIGIRPLNCFLVFLLLQLADDLYRYKVQNDHIYPVINRFKAKQVSIERTFQVEDSPRFWQDNNCVIVNLHDVSLDMRKTIPMLLAKNIYNSHKKKDNKKTLNIIIDEAHNILSKTSFRETEDWKDYRLETFEEIIKEGRKYGVFLTISSQRPNDISETIISQAHNYFIHQLINEKDLQTIGKAVSYIDKISEESIPTLAVGTCIFSGIATPMPLKLKVAELPDNKKPDSHTLKFKDVFELISIPS
ncbi:MAG: ATP-binding protein [Elusimicrobia bacterium]|nr:ATP-binding protein [Elusimicrobiota bacterium]